MIVFKNKLAILALGLLFVTCKSENPNFQIDSANPEFLHRSQDNLSDVLIHDIFSPPVASRNFMYPSIAAYEIARHLDQKYKSFAGQIKHLQNVPQPEETKEYCYPLAATVAFNTSAKKFVFTEDGIDTFLTRTLTDFQDINIPKDVYQRSVDFGLEMAAFIGAWADKDNYAQTRSFPKFSVTNDDGRWKPTPPAYGDGIEPHWNDIRPLVIDSAQQFRPDFPTNYSTDKNSIFYKETIEVYDAVNEASEEHKEIANFWDCNPYKLNVIGHVMTAAKKITPGGHWIGIAKIAARKDKADFAKTSYTYALTAIALFDGFISCWDEKYRSNVIRPETVINDLIDEQWEPLLQTPPFPEYTSGHSVVSSAAAMALTDIYGDNFSFDDDTEIQFGLPIRSFESFIKASEEAAVSRLYGGIHYRPAIDNGVTQGRAMASHILEKINVVN